MSRYAVLYWAFVKYVKVVRKCKLQEALTLVSEARRLSESEVNSPPEGLDSETTPMVQL